MRCDASRAPGRRSSTPGSGIRAFHEIMARYAVLALPLPFRVSRSEVCQSHRTSRGQLARIETVSVGRTSKAGAIGARCWPPWNFGIVKVVITGVTHT